MSNDQQRGGPAGRSRSRTRSEGPAAAPVTNIPATESAEPAVVMHADRAVVRNGRSQSITIPNHIAEAIGLEVGETVRISVRSDGSLTIQAMETVHTGGMTILKPKKTSFKRPIGVVPIIPEGRTIRKANRLHADMPQANHG